MKAVALLGGIGIGKTSLINHFISNTADEKVIPIFENINGFQKFQCHNPLYLSYLDPAKNCAITQMHIIKELNNHFRHIGMSIPEEERNETLLLTDRSLFSPIPFSETFFSMGYFSEFTKDFLVNETILQAEQTLENLRATYVGAVFLHGPPQTCLDRIKQRGREIESTISIEYLEILDNKLKANLQFWRTKCGQENVITLETDTMEVINQRLTEFIYSL